MAPIEWRADFSVGVEALDDDHKILIDLINRLRDGAEGGSKVRALETTFRILLGFAEDHFRREEEMMEAFGYPELQSHRQAHEELRDDILCLHIRHLAEADSGGAVYGVLCDFLETWLNHHLLLVDMAYRDYFERIGRRQAGELEDAPH